MRISDWSSDVCSSDLGPRVPGAWLWQPGRAAAAAGHARTAGRTRPRLRRRAPAQHLREPGADGTRHPHLTPAPRMLAGKPACISRRMAWTALRIDVDPELRCCCAVGNGLANPSDVYVLGGSEGACVACHSAALTSSAHFPPMGTGGTTQGAGMEVRPLLPHDGRAYADLRVLELEEHASALPLPRLQAELECLALGPDDVLRNYFTSGTIVWGVFDRLTRAGATAVCRRFSARLLAHLCSDERSGGN